MATWGSIKASIRACQCACMVHLSAAGLPYMSTHAGGQQAGARYTRAALTKGCGRVGVVRLDLDGSGLGHRRLWVQLWHAVILHHPMMVMVVLMPVMKGIVGLLELVALLQVQLVSAHSLTAQVQLNSRRAGLWLGGGGHMQNSTACGAAGADAP